MNNKLLFEILLTQSLSTVASILATNPVLEKKTVHTLSRVRDSINIVLGEADTDPALPIARTVGSQLPGATIVKIGTKPNAIFPVIANGYDVNGAVVVSATGSDNGDALIKLLNACVGIHAVALSQPLDINT